MNPIKSHNYPLCGFLYGTRHLSRLFSGKLISIDLCDLTVKRSALTIFFIISRDPEVSIEILKSEYPLEAIRKLMISCEGSGENRVIFGRSGRIFLKTKDPSGLILKDHPSSSVPLMKNRSK